MASHEGGRAAGRQEAKSKRQWGQRQDVVQRSTGHKQEPEVKDQTRKSDTRTKERRRRRRIKLARQVQERGYSVRKVRKEMSGSEERKIESDIRKVVKVETSLQK